MTCEKSSHLMKTVFTNLAEDLKRYEKPDYAYELITSLTTGKIPTTYKVMRVLAVGTKFLRDVTTERDSETKAP